MNNEVVDIAKDFMGVGFKFPIQVDETTGRFKTSSYEEDIKEAIRIILGTRKGERVRHADFGCDIHEYTFESMNEEIISRMQNAILDALKVWEPRITDINVDVDRTKESSGMLVFDISYVVRTTNNPNNLVYPFYINEGYGIEE